MAGIVMVTLARAVSIDGGPINVHSCINSVNGNFFTSELNKHPNVRAMVRVRIQTGVLSTATLHESNMIFH